MSMLDALIAQIQAAPDDDAPRLAWANAVGGERGELVIVQCRLASGAVVNRDEWRRLRARERELLAANGVEWSGLAGEYPSSCVFRRGFVEALGVVCSYDSRLDRILGAVPLARSVANELVDQDDYDFAKLVANPRCSELAALRIGSHSAAAPVPPVGGRGDRAIEQLAKHGVALRALAVTNCSRVGARLLEESGLLARVERLALGSVEDGARIIAAAPRLRALYIGGALDRYASAIPRTVVELECHVSGGIDAVAALAIAPTLERLRVEALEFTWDFETLGAFPALRSLDLSRAKPGPRYVPVIKFPLAVGSFAIDRPGVLPALREVSLGFQFDQQSIESVARAFGPQLDTLHWSGRVPHDARSSQALRETIEAPLGAGDAAVAAHVDGEFVVGMMPPWARRPLEFGDNGGGPWFEGGVVAVRN